MKDQDDVAKAGQQPIAILISLLLFTFCLGMEYAREKLHEAYVQFDFPVLLTGLQFMGWAALAAMNIKNYKNLSKRQMILLFLIGVGEFVSKVFICIGYFRLPVVIDVVIQASRVVPTILFRRYVFRTKGNTVDDILGVMIVFGITVCGLTDYKLFNGFRKADAVMQCLAIVLEAAVVNLEYSLLTKDKINATTLQGFTGTIAFLIGLIGSFFYDLPKAIDLFKSNGSIKLSLTLLGFVVASALAGVTFFWSVSSTGVVTPVMMSTIKKSVGVLVAYYSSKAYELSAMI